jgi:hypothetical protein
MNAKKIDPPTVATGEVFVLSDNSAGTPELYREMFGADALSFLYVY